ncbi:P-loop containing nucleoside triphosphate hydrolase protein [Coniophora puteana RWD-64-598 SS2]|uniref:RNA helicase n=1 Tax=Coniophora puteana (strain RWD-64-598) TaxID=741705 RepID=A0A5M3MID3_CONPW|nr:P-loop containing nucleoside triphosphate hydrolase protein [Coniophora puteana RWD-64-598 SS2]EIW78544.1 P-loop containing nucleoside triphosphate hydrolase protein [Coniophora puteana RWD-64-598 SS2]
MDIDPQPSQNAQLKRKARPVSGSLKKKTKVQHRTLDTLPWQSIQRPLDTGLDGDEGVLELEEVDDVEIVYEDTENGRVLKFNVSREHGPNVKPKDDQTASYLASVKFDSKPICTFFHRIQRSHCTPFPGALLPSWRPFKLHPHLLQVLHSKNFKSPTPIQSNSLPKAIAGKDIVGVAETGSGKTLAYGLPILQHILTSPRPVLSTESGSSKRQLRALVITPTRELALQVADHLNIFARAIADAAVKREEGDEPDLSAPSKKKKSNGKPSDNEAGSGPPLVSIAAIVGGMSAQKQRRLLDRGIEVMIATPGRLWDVLAEDEDLARQVSALDFLVLDEADRMIETGHFAELDNILRLTIRQSEEDQIEPEHEGGSSGDEGDNDQSGNAGTVAGATPSIAGTNQENGMRTYVFSATLSKDLQQNLKKRRRPKVGKKAKQKPASTLDDLVLRLDFRDPEPEIIDLSPQGGVVSSLKESKIECLVTDKDVYLYYFLLRYPGRTLVFLSSIDGIRRLAPLMELLGLPAYPLHSQLEQRQRLKNLDRFKQTPNAVLLATDIAARGLDIPSVDHVIHYQIPRTADVFVHRSGRTARAMREGFSLLMIAPDERRTVKLLFRSLDRNEDEVLEMSVELALLDKLKERIRVARQIDAQQHKVKKENHDRKWMKEAADAMEIELDSDFMSASEDEGRPTKHVQKKASGKTAALKAELKALLAQPLVAKGVSTSYVTSGSRPIAADFVAGDCE